MKHIVTGIDETATTYGNISLALGAVSLWAAKMEAAGYSVVFLEATDAVLEVEAWDRKGEPVRVSIES